MSQDIHDHLIDRIKVSENLSGIRNCGNISQFMVYVRYIHDGKILDDFLFCRGLTSKSTAHDVLKVVSDFFTTEGLSWENVIVWICTDSAPAMLGSRSGFLKLAKKYNPSIVGIHCMIHRQALASKSLPDLLRVHLQTVLLFLKIKGCIVS